MAAYHGGGSYQDPDEASEWDLDRAHDPEWRPPVEDDGQPSRYLVRCGDGKQRHRQSHPDWISAMAASGRLNFVVRLSCGPHTVVPVPADPMPVYGLEPEDGAK